jgi:hypothetical protein
MWLVAMWQSIGRSIPYFFLEMKELRDQNERYTKLKRKL